MKSKLGYYRHFQRYSTCPSQNLTIKRLMVNEISIIKIIDTVTINLTIKYSQYNYEKLLMLQISINILVHMVSDLTSNLRLSVC